MKASFGQIEMGKDIHPPLDRLVTKKCSAIFFLSKVILFLLVILWQNKAVAQNQLNIVRNNWLEYTDASNSLYHHLAREAYSFLDKRASAVAAIRSLPDWEKRQKVIRKTLLEIVGPFPAKNSLNPRITATIEKDGYQVENIIYESQPSFYVTSSLFIPHGLKGKAPAIIYCSGHTELGYRDPIYQHVILNLVRKGFIVFAFDPVGEGERAEYYYPETGKSSVGGPTAEHSYPGVQALITGSSQARYMIWDGIRAVDYLLSRKEVDPSRIGITGRSGGGTQTAYIAALDDRIKAAAPENYITNFTRLIESVGPQDAEQNLVNVIAHEIDMPDFLIVRAPKPTLMITTTRDFFPIQGAIETAKEVSRIYHAYGHPDYFRMVTDDSIHASTKKNREAMYAFFQRYLDNAGDSTDEELPVLTPKQLQVTKTGQVSTSLKSETVFSINSKIVPVLEHKLQVSRANFPLYFEKVLKSAKKTSGYLRPEELNTLVFAGGFQNDGYDIEKYFIKGEGQYPIPYLLIKPAHSNRKALIYLQPDGKPREISSEDEIEWFVKKGFTVLAPDLIGTGEIGSAELHGDSNIKGVSYNLWFLSMLIGRSIVGVQTGDVVRLANLVKKSPGIDVVYGLAWESMAPVLLHAAAFDSTIRRIALIRPYSSYRSITVSRLYNPAFVPSLVPGALRSYDLPDLAATIAPRKLMLVDVTDGTGNTGNPNGIKEDLQVIRAAYHYWKADGQLKIIKGQLPQELGSLYNSWIK